MSGICGIVGKIDNTLLDRMCAAIVHRGPAFRRTYVGKRAALGIQVWQPARLELVDEQPSKNERDTIWAVLDGDVYNWPGLCRELEGKGHRFQNRCPTETLVHAYEAFGLSLVCRLDGDYAFAIWDDAERQLVLGRDRFGTQPLYYAQVNGAFLFGSEIKALLQHQGLQRRVNETALWNYAGLLVVPGPETILQQVYQIEPASVLTYRQGQLDTHIYWRPDFCHKMHEGPQVLAEHILQTLRDSVGRRLLSGVPIAIMLSGGIDAGAVLVLAREITDRPILTFTCGLENEGGLIKGDAFPLARLSAEHVGSVHHELTIGPSDVLSSLPDILWHFDEPYAAGIPTYFLAREMREHSPYVLSGTGADGLFGWFDGPVDRYDRPYRYQRWPAAARLLPSLLLRTLEAGMSVVPALEKMSLLSRSRNFLRGLDADIPGEIADRISRELAIPSQREICTPSLTRQVRSGADWGSIYRRHWGETNAREAKDAEWSVYLQTLYPDEVFKYTDRLTSAFGLKHRSPFVDYQLADLAVRIAPKYRKQGGQLKPLLRRALASRLPARILQGDNPGFSLPYDIWLRGPFRDLAHDLLCSSRFRERGYFVPAAISQIVANVVDSPSTPVTFGQVYRVWDLMMLELWFRIYVDRHAQSEADLPSL